MISADLLTRIGRFGKPHGVKGEIPAYVEDVDLDFDSLPCFFLEFDGLLVPFFIASTRPKGSETVLLTVNGMETQEKAAKLTNKDIYVETARLPEAEDDDDTEGFYLDDLIGFSIKIDDGATIGVISDFDDSTDNWLFAVGTPAGTQILVPANADLIEDVDTDNETITMNLPMGLIDL